jgi:hypothetical protein
MLLVDPVLSLAPVPVPAPLGKMDFAGAADEDDGPGPFTVDLSNGPPVTTGNTVRFKVAAASVDLAVPVAELVDVPAIPAGTDLKDGAAALVTREPEGPAPLACPGWRLPVVKTAEEAVLLPVVAVVRRAGPEAEADAGIFVEEVAPSLTCCISTIVAPFATRACRI